MPKRTDLWQLWQRFAQCQMEIIRTAGKSQCERRDSAPPTHQPSKVPVGTAEQLRKLSRAEEPGAQRSKAPGWPTGQSPNPVSGGRAPDSPAAGHQLSTSQLSTSSSMVVALLAGLDFHIETVLRRRERTGGKRSEGTRRILGFVEIKHRFPVHGLIGVEKSPRLVSLAQV